MLFQGERRISHLWYYYCECSEEPADDPYRTHGVVHTYAKQTGAYMPPYLYDTVWYNVPTRASDGYCGESGRQTDWSNGVDGGINPHYRQEDWCYITWPEVWGTWGAGVRYKAAGNDRELETGHWYVEAEG